MNPYFSNTNFIPYDVYLQKSYGFSCSCIKNGLVITQYHHNLRTLLISLRTVSKLNTCSNTSVDIKESKYPLSKGILFQSKKMISLFFVLSCQDSQISNHT